LITLALIDLEVYPL